MVYHFKYVDSAGWKSWFEMLRAAGLLSYFSNNCSPSLISSFTAFSSTLPKGFSSFNGLLYNFTFSLFVFLLKLFFFLFLPNCCSATTTLCWKNRVDYMCAWISSHPIKRRYRQGFGFWGTVTAPCCVVSIHALSIFNPARNETASQLSCRLDILPMEMRRIYFPYSKVNKKKKLY